MKENHYQGDEWAGADSQREIKQKARRMTRRQKKEVEKESIKFYLMNLTSVLC